MKLSRKELRLSALFIALIIPLLLANVSTAFLPQASSDGKSWGVSSGDVLYYVVNSTSEDMPSEYVKYEVKSVEAGSVSTGGGNWMGIFVYVDFYLYINNQWEKSNPPGTPEQGFQIGGYNATNDEWFGAMWLFYRIPAPTPIPLDMSFINDTLYLFAFLVMGPSVNSAISGNQVSYWNSTNKYVMEFDSEGICTTLKYLSGSDVEYEYAYSSEDPTTATGDQQGIDGYSPIFTAAFALATIYLIVKNKKR